MPPLRAAAAPARIRTAALLLVTLLLSLTMAADAATPTAGKFQGKLNDYTSKVTFTVSADRSRLKRFHVDAAPVYCGTAALQDVTVYVPSAKIRSGGSFYRKYPVRSDGEQVGYVELKGKFTTSTSASGDFYYSSNYGCYGRLKWRATRR